jgi:hypothetical protein
MKRKSYFTAAAALAAQCLVFSSLAFAQGAPDPAVEAAAEEEPLRLRPPPMKLTLIEP